MGGLAPVAARTLLPARVASARASHRAQRRHRHNNQSRRTNAAPHRSSAPPRVAGRRCRADRPVRSACGRSRSIQNRIDPAAERTVRIDRQAGRSGVPAVHAKERRHRGRSQGRADRQGRYGRRARDDQANRAGADRPQSGQHPRGIRIDAAGARYGAGCHRSEDADDRHGGGDVDRHVEIALTSCAVDSRCRRSPARSPTGP